MPLNTQAKEKRFYHPDGFVELHHIFSTMQGEGPFAGERAIFIRLAGCNLQCPYCDTDYTSSRELASPTFITEEVLEMIRETERDGHLVVISGGEPFRQNLTGLVTMLVANGLRVQIETNGTSFDPDFPYNLATIVCSPKTGNIHPLLVPHITALKYVVHADQIDVQDGLPVRALDHKARPTTAKPPANFTGVVYVQPIDVDDPVENLRHRDAAVRSCMTYGHRLCLQLHKILDLE